MNHCREDCYTPAVFFSCTSCEFRGPLCCLLFSGFANCRCLPNEFFSAQLLTTNNILLFWLILLSLSLSQLSGPANSISPGRI